MARRERSRLRGDSVARSLEGGEAKNVAAGADFEGPLVDWAHRIDSQMLGRPGGQQFLFDSVRVNVSLPPATFAKPAGGGSAPGR